MLCCWTLSHWNLSQHTHHNQLFMDNILQSFCANQITSYLNFQVRRVQIKQCEDVMLGLDLTGVNPLDIPISFKNCGKVSFSYINFDQQFSGGQILKLEIDTVTSLALEGLDVTDALQVKIVLVSTKLIRNQFYQFDLKPINSNLNTSRTCLHSFL